MIQRCSFSLLSVFLYHQAHTAPGPSQPPLGSGQRPVSLVLFPAGVYPGSITPHNGLGSGLLPPAHDVPSRHHPLDATTSSHHHLSPLPMAEGTRDGYVHQASPLGAARGALGGRQGGQVSRTIYLLVTDNENSQPSGNTDCGLHSTHFLCMIPLVPAVTLSRQYWLLNASFHAVPPHWRTLGKCCGPSQRPLHSGLPHPEWNPGLLRASLWRLLGSSVHLGADCPQRALHRCWSGPHTHLQPLQL